jgi:ubiquinone/menaquinone biosynthesis C-methylase UbiE
MSTFDEKARDWDTPQRQARAEVVAQAIRASVPLAPSMRAIDLGAGTGLLGLALAADVGEMVLAEPSAGMREVIREKLAAGSTPHVSAIAFEVPADPPPGEPFDLAVSMLVLHHLHDTAAALRAIHRLLRPGGRIALADLDAEDGSFHGPGVDVHHGFDRDALAAKARAAGFATVRFVTAYEMTKEVGGARRSYPVFLMVAGTA